MIRIPAMFRRRSAEPDPSAQEVVPAIVHPRPAEAPLQVAGGGAAPAQDIQATLDGVISRMLRSGAAADALGPVQVSAEGGGVVIRPRDLSWSVAAVPGKDGQIALSGGGSYRSTVAIVPASDAEGLARAAETYINEAIFHDVQERLQDSGGRERVLPDATGAVAATREWFAELAADTPGLVETLGSPRRLELSAGGNHAWVGLALQEPNAVDVRISNDGKALVQVFATESGGVTALNRRYDGTIEHLPELLKAAGRDIAEVVERQQMERSYAASPR